MFDKKIVTLGTKCRQKGKANPPSLPRAMKEGDPSVPNIEGVRVVLGQVGSEAHLVKNKIPKIAKLNEIKLRVSSVKSGVGDGWMC